MTVDVTDGVQTPRRTRSMTGGAVYVSLVTCWRRAFVYGGTRQCPSPVPHPLDDPEHDGLCDYHRNEMRQW